MKNLKSLLKGTALVGSLILLQATFQSNLIAHPSDDIHTHLGQNRTACSLGLCTTTRIDTVWYGDISYNMTVVVAEYPDPKYQMN